MKEQDVGNGGTIRHHILFVGHSTLETVQPDEVNILTNARAGNGKTRRGRRNKHPGGDPERFAIC